MPKISNGDPSAQLAYAQQLLVEYLRVDVELAFTLLRMAEIEEAADSPTRKLAALAKVREALSAIRHLTGRILNPTTWSEIHAKANELERALKAFEKSNPKSRTHN